MKPAENIHVNAHCWKGLRGQSSEFKVTIRLSAIMTDMHLRLQCVTLTFA